MATLYVNADHASSSDAGNYTAAQNPATPLKTIPRAMNLAVLGDTINVLPAGAANPSDPHGQTDVYAGMVDDTFGGVWSNANKDATGGRITLQGVTVAGHKPKFTGLAVRSLKNWKVDNFQIGYDLGSGFDYNTAGGLIGPTDTLFSNCLFTGGGANILGFHGHCRWENCELVSKIRASPESFMEGAGFRLLCRYASDETAGPDDWVEFISCNFHDVQGEDAIQMLGSIGVGNCLAEDCTFDSMAQSNAAHTDAIQTTGLQALIVRRCKFGVNGPVASMIIGSDSTNVTTLDTLILENNLFVGGPETGFSTQFGGVNHIKIRHNTWARSNFAGLNFYGHSEFPASVEITNNVIDKFTVVNTPTWGATEQHHNVITFGPVTTGDFALTPEFGTSSDTVYELANTPINTAGVDQAAVSDITTDRLGRTRKGAAPDCGCHESNPAVAVTVAPRPPILVSTSPSSGASGVSPTANVTATFYPKPGKEIAAGSVTPTSAYVRDAAGLTVPAVVTLSALDVNSRQTISLDLKESLAPEVDGELFPLVSYTATLTDVIADTEGSVFGGTSWTFRVAGTGGPAIGTGLTVGDPAADASHSMAAAIDWPPGTTVNVYPLAAWPERTRAPSGTAVSTAVVSGSSVVTFTGLAEAIRYVAYANGRGVTFLVPSPLYRTIRVQ